MGAVVYVVITLAVVAAFPSQPDVTEVDYRDPVPNMNVPDRLDIVWPLPYDVGAASAQCDRWGGQMRMRPARLVCRGVDY